MYRDGAIPRDSLIWREGMADWQPVSQFIPAMPEPVRVSYSWNPVNAFVSCLKRYACFSGRASRSEFWFFSLSQFLIYIILAVFTFFVATVSLFQSVSGHSSGAIGISIFLTLLNWCVTLGLLVPSLAVTARRLHDMGMSAWAILFGLIPIAGPIILIVLCCMESEKGRNDYGDGPDGPA